MPTALRWMTRLTLLAAALNGVAVLVRPWVDLGVTAFGVRHASAWLLAGLALAALALGLLACWRSRVSWWVQVLLAVGLTLAELLGSHVDAGQPWTLLVLSFRVTRAWYGVSPPDPGRAEYDG